MIHTVLYSVKYNLHTINTIEICNYLPFLGSKCSPAMYLMKINH